MQDKYYDRVKELITRNGEMGVNALSKALDVPLSSIQNYMNKQHYFVKTDNRKWDLPERATNNPTAQPVENFNELVEAQLTTIKAMTDMLMNQFATATQLFKNQKIMTATMPPPVAESSNSKLNDKRLIEIDSFVERIQGVFKKQKQFIPEELRDLLFNFDYVGLILKEGKDYTNDFLEGEIYEMLAGKTDTLTEDTIQILKDNQIGQTS